MYSPANKIHADQTVRRFQEPARISHDLQAGQNKAYIIGYRQCLHNTRLKGPQGTTQYLSALMSVPLIDCSNPPPCIGVNVEAYVRGYWVAKEKLEKDCCRAFLDDDKKHYCGLRGCMHGRTFTEEKRKGIEEVHAEMEDLAGQSSKLREQMDLCSKRSKELLDVEPEE